MDSEKSKPRSLLRTVLVVSLALNVAVIGAVVGLTLSGRSHAGPPQRMSFEFGALGRVLDRDDRRAISEAMRRNGPRPLSRDAVKLQLGAIAEALRAEPFDPDTLTGLIAELRNRSTRVQQNAQTAFVAHLTAMSADERATLADKLERGKP
ncbi:MAG: periplasmic heavy metal sensor [Yoonia sp.]|jgi:uncharacterized membrane protein|tara:strand:+ start:366 stop:818 length:453 start_codon:yes stop_codon:yes gene_type:complete